MDGPDDRPVIWDQWNRKHILEDHPERHIQEHEVDEVLTDPGRVEEYRPSRDSYVVRGTTLSGRVLIVAWVEAFGGRYAVHARPEEWK